MLLFEFFTMRISVRFSDGSKVTQNKINLSKIELKTSRSSVHCSANCAKSLFGCLSESLRNKQIPTCEVVHETKESSNGFLPTRVSRALDWWSGSHGFKPHWGQFLTKFILCCVKTRLKPAFGRYLGIHCDVVVLNSMNKTLKLCDKRCKMTLRSVLGWLWWV